MLNSGEKKFALCAKKKVNILTLVLSEKKFLNETKKHNPPLQVKWAVPYTETKDRATRTPLKTGVNSCALEGYAVPAPRVALVVLLLLQSR